MTLLKELQSHRSGLIRIKSELFWYEGRGWDGAPGRVCLILDAAERGTTDYNLALSAAATTRRYYEAFFAVAAAFLLIDGFPHWVWVAQEDVELIT